MKLLSKIIGNIIRVFAFLVLLVTALRALIILNFMLGFVGLFLGIITLPLSVPITCIYDGIHFHHWITALLFFIGFPLIMGVAALFLHWGESE